VNSGLSSTFSRTYSPIPTSTRLSKNGIRQPHVSNDGPVVALNTWTCRREQQPQRYPQLRPARREPPPVRVTPFHRDEHRPAPFTADRGALDQPQEREEEGRGDADPSRRRPAARR
jgi:hypothetical protein